MRYWLLSVPARGDLLRYRQAGSTGFGLMAGGSFGHIYIVDRLLLLGPLLEPAVQAFNNASRPEFSDLLGIFALNQTTHIEPACHGLLFWVEPDFEEMTFLRYHNGAGRVSPERMEVFGDKQRHAF
jgi:hypothetical protein